MVNNLTAYPLLARIDTPEQLRELPESGLPQLAKELREYLLDTLNKISGHLGASLGTVELAIALHYVFNTPNDRLIWDVGHQAYAHKMLTGRKELLHTIRQYNGLAPFPKRDESIYDAFGVGHSSTSIGAGLGMAIAAQMTGSERKVIAVIGDGAMTAGMAFEALNHAGDIKANLLVILNDNDMSISHNVGGLSNYLARVLSSKLYTSVRENSKKVLSVVPPVWELAKRTEEHVKGMVIPGTFFEELGFNYLGPIDGHDLETLIPTLRNLRDMSGPQLLHIVTKKGKGYPPAEADPIYYHAPAPGYLHEANLGQVPVTSSKLTYSQVFGDWLCDMAALDPRLVGITPAMREGSGMVRFSKEYPHRYYDVGIAEQHSVTFAAGLACDGQKPIVAIYSTFLQRAYDQLIHDVALQNLPVLFAIDRGGIVGGDGATHHGCFDLSFLRCIPNLLIMVPANENECRQMLYTGFQYPGPSAVRYPRGTGPGVPVKRTMEALSIGKAEICLTGKSVALLAFGSMLAEALEVGAQLNATVINMRFVKPLDTELIRSIAAQYQLIVTLEENVVAGGAGSAVNEYLAAQGLMCHILNIGLPDYFIEHGSPAELLAHSGLKKEAIMKRIRERISQIKQTQDNKCSMS